MTENNSGKKPDACAAESKHHRWAISDWQDRSHADESKQDTVCMILNWKCYIQKHYNLGYKINQQVPILPVSRS